jgi:BASS family bile acid:Na+ symporter
MDAKQLIMFAIQLSIIATVFGFGLKATPDDLLYLVRRPGLLLRSLLAIFVIMPVIAILLAQNIGVSQAAGVVLIALALSPVPPMLPKKLLKAGGHASYALALMVTLALLSVVLVPLLVYLVGLYFGTSRSLPPQAVAGVFVNNMLLPLGAGMALRAAAPRLADWIASPVARTGQILLPIALLGLVGASLPSLWALAGTGAALAMAILIIAGLIVGHLLGGPDADSRTVLAISSASRHPAIAMAIVTANFPEQNFGALVLLYLLVGAVVGAPYIMWRKRMTNGAILMNEPLSSRTRPT